MQLQFYAKKIRVAKKNSYKYYAKTGFVANYQNKTDNNNTKLEENTNKKYINGYGVIYLRI